MNTQVSWGFNWSPDFVSVMFTYNLSFSLKIRVYWQKIHHINCAGSANIRFSAYKSTKHFAVALNCNVSFTVQYYLPKGMRYATLEERKQFYTKEFNTQKVAEWFGDRLGNTKFAVIMGRHTKIFPNNTKKTLTTTIIIDDYTDLADLQAQIVDFLPEAVYYDRNLYDEKGKKLGRS